MARHRARIRRPGITLAVVMSVLLAAMTCRLFVWPARDAPVRADAVLSLNGPAEKSREATAVRLARSGVAPVLVFSQGTWRTTPCPRVAGVRVICFVPHPGRTVGEVQLAARLAARNHWRTILLVSGQAQDTRARLLMKRCFAGRVEVVPASAPLYDLPYAVAYEWGALVKALLVERSC